MKLTWSKFLSFSVFVFYRTWAWSWRIKISESAHLRKRIETNEPFILAVWHGDELALTRFSVFYKLSALTSTSKDGEIMNNVLTWFGFKTARGSSTRGGAEGLRNLLKLSQTGHMPIFAVDGPKGPYHIPKPGVFEASRVLKAPIFPGAIAFSRAYIFKKSWNRAALPWPFAKVVLVWDDPLPTVSRNDDPKGELLKNQLIDRIDAAGRKAHNIIAGK